MASVTNGMSGCMRRIDASSTKIRLRWACRRAASSLRRVLVTSTYQSQTSFQKKFWTPRAISPKVYFSIPSVTMRVALARRLNIQASAAVSATGSPGV